MKHPCVMILTIRKTPVDATTGVKLAWYVPAIG
jgi:hypothetical protein